jgi:hypothetical protein
LLIDSHISIHVLSKKYLRWAVYYFLYYLRAKFLHEFLSDFGFV